MKSSERHQTSLFRFLLLPSGRLILEGETLLFQIPGHLWTGIARNCVSLCFDWGQGCAKSVSCTRLYFFFHVRPPKEGFDLFVCLFEEACRLLIADLALKLLLGWEGLLECSSEACGLFENCTQLPCECRMLLGAC